jgi:hypothetical protein
MGGAAQHLRAARNRHSPARQSIAAPDRPPAKSKTAPARVFTSPPRRGLHSDFAALSRKEFMRPFNERREDGPDAPSRNRDGWRGTLPGDWPNRREDTTFSERGANGKIVMDAIIHSPH